MMNRLLTRSIFHSYRLFNNQTNFVPRKLQLVCRLCSQDAQIKDNLHCIIQDKEEAKGSHETQEFKAETKKLLDIVAKSLYSDQEIFIRELVSNANDALEKLRYLRNTGLQVLDSSEQTPLEIHIKTDKDKNLFIIQDTGVGMTKEEMINNLGTIAKSGSQEFINNLENNNDTSIIGKFGVGFYSSFMVADKVDVYSRDKKQSVGYHWESFGTDGSFKISEAFNVDSGTKIVLHLKKDCDKFCDEQTIEKILTKYNSYIINPIFLNGKKMKMMKPIWLKDANSISESEHEAFYQYSTGLAHEKPRYTFSFKTDAPIDIKALFYVPDSKPVLYMDQTSGLTLYSRKVMIMNKTDKLLPPWLQFLKGVVESDDIPLNLSRELLQDNALINKINKVITTKILKFLLDQSRKDPLKFNQFYKDFGFYLKVGIGSTQDPLEKENISRLLRYESNKLAPGELTSFQEYSERMKAGTRDIYYLASANRHAAESSPYMEGFNKSDKEVLFMYDPADEVTILMLNRFEGKNLVSVESQMEQDEVSEPKSSESSDSLVESNAEKELIDWCESHLKPHITRARVSHNRLGIHPCAISVRDAGAVRYFMQTTHLGRTDQEKRALMSATFELNTGHELVQKMMKLKDEDEKLAHQLLDQMYQIALIHAGLPNDSRNTANSLTELLTAVFKKIP